MHRGREKRGKVSSRNRVSGSQCVAKTTMQAERNVTRPILACGERTPGRHQNFPETAFTSAKNAKAVVYQRRRLAWPGLECAPRKIPTFCTRDRRCRLTLSMWCLYSRTYTYMHNIRTLFLSFLPLSFFFSLFSTNILSVSLALSFSFLCDSLQFSTSVFTYLSVFVADDIMNMSSPKRFYPSYRFSFFFRFP